MLGERGGVHQLVVFLLGRFVDMACSKTRWKRVQRNLRRPAVTLGWRTNKNKTQQLESSRPASIPTKLQSCRPHLSLVRTYQHTYSAASTTGAVCDSPYGRCRSSRALFANRIGTYRATQRTSKERKEEEGGSGKVELQCQPLRRSTS